LFIQGRDLYNSTIPLFAKAFKELGYHPVCIDLNEPDSANRLSLHLNDNTSFFFSIDFAGIDITVNGGASIFEYFNIPLVTLLRDTIDGYAMTIPNTYKNVYIGIYDKYDEHYLKIINPANKYFHYQMCGYQAAKKNCIDIGQREYDISFCGNIIPLNEIRRCWSDNYGGSIIKLCDNLVERLLDDETKIPVDACNEVVNEYGFSFHEHYQVLYQIIREVMLYVRSARRVHLLETLANSGLQIDCFGFGNQFRIFSDSNIVYHHPLNFYENLDVMNNSKFVLNTNSLTKYAVTERQLSAMMNGAIVLTDSNDLIDSLFEPGSDLITFTHRGLSKLPELIWSLLSDEEKMRDISMNAQHKALNGFAVGNSAEHIIQLLRAEGR